MASNSVAAVRWWWGRLLSGQPHQTIGNASNPTPYMLRWWLLPRNKWTKLYLHKFIRSDEDRADHDHPWNFWSLILWRSYIEWRDGKPHRRRPGSIAYRRATDRHHVELIDGKPCWTLVLTGPKIREWGFWCLPGRDGLRVAKLYGVPPHFLARFVHWRDWDDNAGCGEA